MQVFEREYSAFDIDETRWAAPKPFGLSGCIRLRNDAEFLRASVVSHLPYLEECVLALQPSEDNTAEIAAQLAAEYPDKVRIERYPVIPVFPGAGGNWAGTPADSIYSFVYLSNWALSKCRYSWICKVEADVVCLSSFQSIRDRIATSADGYYGRVILNVAGPMGTLVSATNPRNAGWDEAVFPNTPGYQFVKTDRYEAVDFTPHPHECLGFSGLHLKRMKARVWGKVKETYASFTRAGVAQALSEFNQNHVYAAADNPLGPDCLFENWRDYLKEAVRE